LWLRSFALLLLTPRKRPLKSPPPPMRPLKSPPSSLTLLTAPYPPKTPPSLSRSSAAAVFAALLLELYASFGAPLLAAGHVKQQQLDPELPPNLQQQLDPPQPQQLEPPPELLPPPEQELPLKLLPVQRLGAGPGLPPEPKPPPEPGKGIGKPDAWPKSPPTEPELPRIRLPPELEP